MAEVSSRRKVRESVEPTGFDVTQVVGRVEFANTGEHTPHEAAMLVIGQYGGEGTYTFPTPDGGNCKVTVEYEVSPFSSNGEDAPNRF